MTRVPRLLLVAPVPTAPPDQGNAARLLAFGAALGARGAVVEYLYYATEGLSPAQRTAMAGQWAALHVEPDLGKPEPSWPGLWALDDWCPAVLADRVAALEAARGYDAVIVSYVWLSGALLGVRRALRVIDTHDLFGDRHRVAEARGIDPSWFFTSAAEEARGLDRADLVLAIQPEEAAVLRARTARPVLIAGHAAPVRFLTRPPAAHPRATFGYLGSGNPWNLAALAALDAALVGVDWLVAGSVLRHAPGFRSRPEVLDPLPDAAAFHDAVACVLNPSPGGTGLKIKTIEALLHGRPVLGTADAFTGLPGARVATDLPELLAQMRAFAGDAAFRRDVIVASRGLALAYADAVDRQYDALFRELCPG